MFFCVDLRINSDYFPIQHQLPGFYNIDGSVLTARYELNALNIIQIYSSLESLQRQSAPLSATEPQLLERWKSSS